MIKFLRFFLISSIILLSAFMSANSVEMYFINPQTTVRYYNTEFSSIDVLVEPCGIFTRYQFEIELNCKDNFAGKNFQLEFNWSFSLGDYDYMNDAYLWVGDTLVKADMMDKWTANMIYEGIVKRNRDPLLITKNNEQYFIKLFPFENNAPRKFIISLMILNYDTGSYTNSNMTISKLFKTDKQLFTKINKKIAKNLIVGEPTLIDTNFKFINTEEVDGVLYNNYAYDFSNKKYPSYWGCKYVVNTNDNIFMALSKSNENEGYFQISANMDMIELGDHPEVLFLLNYQAGKSEVTTQNVIDGMKNYLKNYRGSNFKFNIISSGDIKNNFLSENWLDINKKYDIDSLFTTNKVQLNENSHLSNVIIDGIDFLKQKGNNSKIILINSSDEFYSAQVSNSFIEKLLNDLPLNIQFSILDHQSKNFRIDSTNPKTNIGNNYFYNIITAKTGGSYYDFDSPAPAFNNFIRYSLNEIINYFEYFEIRLKPTNGLAYNFYSSYSNGTLIANKADNIIGKYYGTTPFEIEIVALKNKKTYFKTIKMNNNGFDIPNIQKTEQIWNFYYLSDLANRITTNDKTLMRKFIDLSIEKRILTNYTAFLALEPWMKKQNDTIFDEKNDPSDADINYEIPSDLSLSIYPNPFTEIVKIRIDNLVESEMIESIIIYDELGNRIHEFDISSIIVSNLELIWQPILVNNGLYIVEIKTNKRAISQKFLKK